MILNGKVIGVIILNAGQNKRKIKLDLHLQMMEAFGLITKNLDNITIKFLSVNIMKIIIFQVLIKA